jgi:hypothetical protein
MMEHSCIEQDYWRSCIKQKSGLLQQLHYTLNRTGTAVWQNTEIAQIFQTAETIA